MCPKSYCHQSNHKKDKSSAQSDNLSQMDTNGYNPSALLNLAVADLNIVYWVNIKTEWQLHKKCNRTPVLTYAWLSRRVRQHSDDALFYVSGIDWLVHVLIALEICCECSGRKTRVKWFGQTHVEFGFGKKKDCWLILWKEIVLKIIWMTKNV